MRSGGGEDVVGVVVWVGGGARPLGVLTGATADGDVTEGPTVGPVATAGLAEVAWLREVVVVVVAELGVGGVTAWAW